jgi:hypothetical protein
VVRTQIYLTEQERAALVALSQASGRPQSEIIREAVDRLIAQFSQSRREAVLDRAAGLWKDRDDLPDFLAIRQGWDRGGTT